MNRWRISVKCALFQPSRARNVPYAGFGVMNRPHPLMFPALSMASR